MTFVTTTAPVQGSATNETSHIGAADPQAFQSALGRARESAEADDARRLVRPERTKLSGDQAATALRAAWRSVLGEDPSDKTLSILTAQWAHETGRGESMLNYNFGGIKGHGPSGMGAAYKTREGWGENERRIVDTFRAYGSAEEGATDYVGLLARRFPEAVDAAKAEDPRGFVTALKQRGYFTGNEAAYTSSVTSLARQALAHGFSAIGSDAGPTESLPESWDPFPRAYGPSPIAPLEASHGHALAHVDSGVLFDEITRASLHMSSRKRTDSERDRTRV